MFGRVSRYYTDDLAGNPHTAGHHAVFTFRPGPSAAPGRSRATLRGPSTRARLPKSTATGTTWIDAYVSSPLGSGWMVEHLDQQRLAQAATPTASTGVPLYFPHLNVGRRGLRRRWFLPGPAAQRRGAFNGKISQQRGSHIT